MSIGINNSYSSYYTQAYNKTGSNNEKTKVSDDDKTTASSASTIDKTISEEEYFKNICSKYSNINLNMSDSYLKKDNQITVNVSPNLMNKAINSSEMNKKLDNLLQQIPSLPQYINSLNSMLNGNSVNVKSVSIVIDANGEGSCTIELKQNNSKNTSKTSEEEKLRIKRMKERKERNLKLSKEHKIYSDIAVNIDMSFLDRFDTSI
ncbi:DUF6033 family protein [Clostridium saccharobutylicum]|uniref:Uncharacterized protein n=1 Tax=Clostridium saccharobutylicum DSM 13864 TaxID=1345695 RepID=U5MV36_CLOSA|nr:DUF6033 family protein [Clostridium saccharobutylicum]AGX44664.1 hypothetical protein CLSA_c37030 [Clostridium saccharobutylicum DSM 13864]AQR91953.1 hypothetical protein CLOSC_36810 [Clostridium saccharobutylicum]AQS01855.1 hypothetical protein CSACC_36860 [Clostridium saccharobutylicum]AQS15838.1 hypothetical protein CLOSACC_36860 [Clostridium saccharobutylicum]MBA2903444.1 hypothetical protein [Clostridium saccharobutylicum]